MYVWAMKANSNPPILAEVGGYLILGSFLVSGIERLVSDRKIHDMAVPTSSWMKKSSYTYFSVLRCKTKSQTLLGLRSFVSHRIKVLNQRRGILSAEFNVLLS